MLEINKIYNLDCFKFLEKIDDDIVDLAVIDPPYNLRKAEWDTFKSEKEFFDFTFRWIDTLIPKIKENGSLYIFNTPYNSAFILNYLVGKGLIFQNWITWDKRDGMGGAKRRFSNGQETILFLQKGKSTLLIMMMFACLMNQKRYLWNSKVYCRKCNYRFVLFEVSFVFSNA